MRGAARPSIRSPAFSKQQQVIESPVQDVLPSQEDKQRKKDQHLPRSLPPLPPPLLSSNKTLPSMVGVLPTHSSRSGMKCIAAESK